jgi:hypothetical protein
MDIGEPRKIIEVEPASLPVPETIPMPEPAFPEAPHEPAPSVPATPAAPAPTEAEPARRTPVTRRP